MFRHVKVSSLYLIANLMAVTLFSCGCSGKPPEDRATPNVPKAPPAKWVVVLLDTENGIPLSVEVGADGLAVYRRGGTQEVQLQLTLSEPRTEEFAKAIQSLPQDSWGPSPSPSPTQRPQVTLLKEAKNLHLVGDAKKLIGLLRELEPRPYARDRDDAWLCGSLQEGPENGIFLSITAESADKKEVPKRYRLEPTPNIDRKDDVVIMVAGKIDRQAVDTSMAGPTYNVTSWARWDASPSQKAPSATPASTSAKP